MPRCTRRAITYASRSDRCRVVLLSDLHVGSAYCDERLLRQTVLRIKDDPSALWLGLGDYAEWINRRDPRAREEERATWCWGHTDIAQEQVEFLTRLFADIWPQCIGLIKGNHEDAILRHTERDVYQRLVEASIGPRLEAGLEGKLGLGVSGFVRLAFKREQGSSWGCDIFATHGSVGGRKAGAKALRLQDLWGSHEADVVVMGHSHMPMSLTLHRTAWSQRGNALVRTTRCVNAGTLLGTRGLGWPEYAESKDYPVTIASVVELEIEPDKKRITVKGV